MYKKIKISAYLFGTLWAITPLTVFASGVALEATKSQYAVGDTVTIMASVETAGSPVNTVSGTVLVPTDHLTIQDVRYGNSVISLWVAKPTVDKKTGTVVFSGGVPGGFNGLKGPLFSIIAKATSEGSETASVSDVSVLKNDGLGTPLDGAVGGKATVSIVKAVARPAIDTPTVSTPQLPVADTEAPLRFMPLVSTHPEMFEGAYFVSFSALDGDGGVDRYEINEEPYLISSFSPSEWVVAQSPYLLSYQIWPTQITVRAYDKAGNVREEKATKPIHPLFVTALIICALLFAEVIRRKAVTPPRPTRKK